MPNAMQKDTTKHSSLLTIPLEIRIQICELLFDQNVVIFMSTQGSQLRYSNFYRTRKVMGHGNVVVNPTADSQPPIVDFFFF